MLLRQIERAAELHADQPALSFNRQSYTYQSLMEAVGRMRGWLADHGVQRGECVAIILPNSPHFVIAHLAVLGLGAVSVPINPQHKARDIGWLIEDSEASAVIAWSQLAGETERALGQTDMVRLKVYLGDTIPDGAASFLDIITKEGIDCDSADVAAEEVALILYTSGVSGRARGVELTHGNIATHTAELARRLRLQPTDRFLGILPFSTAVGISANVHLPLSVGGQAEIHSRFHPGDALQRLVEQQTTILVANPTMYSLMARFPSAERSDLSALRFAISCKARLPDHVARDVEDRLKVKLFEAYSTTETCGIITINLFPTMVPRGSVGQPLSGHETRILDDNNRDSPVGTKGKIALRGPCVMKGYHNRPEKTRQIIKDDWMLTGDWGYLDYDSNLYVTAHDSERIIKGGFTVYAREIEEVVEGLPHVHEVAVVGIPDPVYGEEIKLCVVLKEGASISPGEIVEYVKERIAFYKCPKVVKFYKELPRGTGGKIIRSELKEDKG